MWLNRGLTIFFAVSAFGCAAAKQTSTDVCPVQSNSYLQYVDVFDGPPEEMAILMPDQVHDTHGYWSLGYVYDAKRTVTVRCKYANSKTVDVTLEEKVQRCDYKISSKKILSVNCT